MAKNFSVIMFPKSSINLQDKIISKQLSNVFKPFLGNIPKTSKVVLKLDLTNRAAVRGILEYNFNTDDFQSTATGQSAVEVSKYLIADIEDKLFTWNKSVA
jgi:hypothetical protein